MKYRKPVFGFQNLWFLVGFPSRQPSEVWLVVSTQAELRRERFSSVQDGSILPWMRLKINGLVGTPIGNIKQGFCVPV
jgi:hypothetical protein